jgi:hypothetical protein
MGNRAGWIVVGVVVAALTPLAWGQAFRQVDHPAAGPNGRTWLHGIDGGKSIGEYVNDDTGARGSFIYDLATETFTPVSFPGATSTTLSAIGGGRVAGTYRGDALGEHGFVYDGSTFTSIDFPIDVSGSMARPSAVDAARVAGTHHQAGGFSGFIRAADGTLITRRVSWSDGTTIEAFDGGRTLGHIWSEQELFGYLDDGTSMTFFSYPGTFHTEPRDLSGNWVVGNYFAGGVFGMTPMPAFLYDIGGGSFYPYGVPGAESTSINGIDGDPIVGTYALEQGGAHGFIATVPEPGAAWVVLGLTCMLLRRRR